MWGDAAMLVKPTTIRLESVHPRRVPTLRTSSHADYRADVVSTKRWRGWTIAAALSMPACSNDDGPHGAEGMADETSAGTTGGASSMGTTGNASADDSAGTTGNASNDDTSSTTTAST